jgi:hypothetical protein
MPIDQAGLTRCRIWWAKKGTVTQIAERQRRHAHDKELALRR